MRTIEIDGQNYPVDMIKETVKPVPVDPLIDPNSKLRYYCNVSNGVVYHTIPFLLGVKWYYLFVNLKNGQRLIEPIEKEYCRLSTINKALSCDGRVELVK